MEGRGRRCWREGVGGDGDYLLSKKSPLYSSDLSKGFSTPRMDFRVVSNAVLPYYDVHTSAQC